jgi:carboxyl-terminal processing protease
MRTVLKGFLAFSIVSAGFFCGFSGDAIRTLNTSPNRESLQIEPALLAGRLQRLARPSAAQAGDIDELSPIETYQRVLQTISQDYLNAPTDPAAAKEWQTKIKSAGIEGMLSAIGDRYTEYWDPASYRRNMEDTSGRFYGIGAKLDVTREKKVMIVEPIENSPAERIGIRPGDIIIAVDGKPTWLTPKDTIDDVIKRIKGPEGTKVGITIDRKGVAKPKVFTITRAAVVSPVIDSRMQDAEAKIGYIKLDMFNEEAAHQFDRAYDRLKEQKLKALIFDLRDNPGGLLNIATDMASRFIESGPVVWIKQKDGEMASLNVDRAINTELHRGRVPVVVLVNGGSASASEIVSGAIQDAKVGFLVGTRTYGKGLVQTIFPLNPGEGAVKITTQHYYTRDKHDINLKRDENRNPVGGKGGIKPDLVLDVKDADWEKQRAILRENPRDRAKASQFDPQIQKAVSLLRDRLAGKSFPASEKEQPDAPAPKAAENADTDL